LGTNLVKVHLENEVQLDLAILETFRCVSTHCVDIALWNNAVHLRNVVLTDGTSLPMFCMHYFEVELHFMEELKCQMTWKVNHASRKKGQDPLTDRSFATFLAANHSRIRLGSQKNVDRRALCESRTSNILKWYWKTYSKLQILLYWGTPASGGAFPACFLRRFLALYRNDGDTSQLRYALTVFNDPRNGDSRLPKELPAALR
jgi:hypothetical protein